MSPRQRVFEIKKNIRTADPDIETQENANVILAKAAPHQQFQLCGARAVLFPLMLPNTSKMLYIFSVCLDHECGTAWPILYLAANGQTRVTFDYMFVYFLKVEAAAFVTVAQRSKCVI